jgi:hypothetical protein
VRKFQTHYPEWKYGNDIRLTLSEMIHAAEGKLVGSYKKGLIKNRPDNAYEKIFPVWS